MDLNKLFEKYSKYTTIDDIWMGKEDFISAIKEIQKGESGQVDCVVMLHVREMLLEIRKKAPACPYNGECDDDSCINALANLRRWI